MKSRLVKILPSPNCLTLFVIGLISIVLDQSSVLAGLEKSNALKSQLIIHGIIPDVLNESPPNEIQIKYESEQLDIGKFLWPSQALKTKPKMIKYPCDSEQFHVLVMTDLDSPNRTKPVDREFLHWLVGNIPGVAVSRGATLMPYLSPSPAKDTGVHRYVFLVYHQPKGVINFEDQLEFAKKPNNEGRRKFNSTEFAQRYGLGDVVAVSFFRMEWDEHYEKPTVK